MLNLYYLSCNSGNQPNANEISTLEYTQQYIARMQHIRFVTDSISFLIPITYNIEHKTYKYTHYFEDLQ